MTQPNQTYAPHTRGWVVRYWTVDHTAEKTAHFPDEVHGDAELSRLAAMDYAKWPSTAGIPVLRVEVQRYGG